MSSPVLPCTIRDPEDWFPLGNRRTAVSEQAAALCRICPNQQTCLADALRRGFDWGIWGGTYPDERRKMLRRHHNIEQRIMNAHPTELDTLVHQLAGTP